MDNPNPYENPANEKSPTEVVLFWLVFGVCGGLLATDVAFSSAGGITMVLGTPGFLLAASFWSSLTALSAPNHYQTNKIVLSIGVGIVTAPVALIALVCTCGPTLEAMGTSHPLNGWPMYSEKSWVATFSLFMLTVGMIRLVLRHLLSSKAND